MTAEIDLNAETLHARFYTVPPVELTVKRGKTLSDTETRTRMVLNKTGTLGTIIFFGAGGTDGDQALTVDIDKKPEESGVMNNISVRTSEANITTGDIHVELYMTDRAGIRITS